MTRKPRRRLPEPAMRLLGHLGVLQQNGDLLVCNTRRSAVRQRLGHVQSNVVKALPNRKPLGIFGYAKPH